MINGCRRNLEREHLNSGSENTAKGLVEGARRCFPNFIASQAQTPDQVLSLKYEYNNYLLSYLIFSSKTTLLNHILNNREGKRCCYCE